MKLLSYSILVHSKYTCTFSCLVFVVKYHTACLSLLTILQLIQSSQQQMFILSITIINQEIHNSLKMYKISESSKFETSEKFTRFHEDFKVQQGISRFHENLAIILRVLTDFKTSPEILEYSFLKITLKLFNKLDCFVYFKTAMVFYVFYNNFE